MATLFANLPVPAGDGVGAGVDVSAMGAIRTVSVKGTFTGTVTVEISNDGGTTYVPLHSFTEIKQRTFQVSAQYMRVRRSGVVAPAGTPNVDVGGDDIGSSFANLPVTAGDGTGAGVDISALGTFNTIAVSGTFTGTVGIEISLDNVDWLPLMGFTKAMAQSKIFIAQYARVVRSGVGAVPGTPVVNLGAANDPIGAAGIAPGRAITVATVGGDYTSIEAAITAANALVPALSAAAPATILVYPGVYAENPLTLPAYCSLIGLGKARATIIEAVTTTSPIIELEDHTTIDGFKLEGATGVGGAGVYAASVGSALAQNLVVEECTTAFWCDGTAGAVVLYAAICEAEREAVMETGFFCEAGGKLEAISCHVEGSSGSRITTGLRATGAGSILHAYSVDIDECVDAVLVEDSGDINVIGGIIHDSTNQFHVESTGGTIHATGVDSEDIDTYGLWVEGANGTFKASACAIRTDQISIAAGATVLCTFISDFEGDLANAIYGELQVGSPTLPAESVFGEGDSHVRQMSIFRNTNLEVGAWSDITTEMASASGSTADAFAGVGVGQSLYIGGGEKEFPGLKINTTAAIVLGAGSLVWEYWNGAAWTAFTLMAADSILPYESHAVDVFGRIANEQVRFDASNFAGWVQRAVNGATRFWVRCRQAGAITTVPTLEQVKLHTNRTEINSDGVTEYFGSAIITRQVSWHQRMTDDLSGSSPANGTLTLASNITITPIDNRFANSAIDGFGGILTVPIGLDTSRPLTLRVGWIPLANGSAPNDDVEFESRYALVAPGDTLDGSIASTLLSEIVTVGAAQDDVLTEQAFEFDVSEAVPGDKVAFSFFRDATAGNPDDTFPAAIDVVDVEIFGFFWR